MDPGRFEPMKKLEGVDANEVKSDNWIFV